MRLHSRQSAGSRRALFLMGLVVWGGCDRSTNSDALDPATVLANEIDPAAEESKRVEEELPPEDVQQEPDDATDKSVTVEDVVMSNDQVASDAVEPDTEPSQTGASPEADPSQAMVESGPPPYRIWLPTTAGPLLVDLQLWIGDEPVSVVYANRLEEVIESARGGSEGSLTWDDLIAYTAEDPETFGRSSSQAVVRKRNLILRYDLNRNKIADESEVSKFLFRDSGFDSAFRLHGTDSYREINRSLSKLFEAIDSDGNRKLDSSELDAAAETLLTLIDQNADQRIDLVEAFSPSEDNNSAWKRSQSNRRGEVAMDFSGYVDWTSVSYAIDGMEVQTPMGMESNAVALLDEDQDGSISSGEAKGLLSVKPAMTLRVRFSEVGGDDISIEVIANDPAVRSRIQQTDRKDRVLIADSRLQVAARVIDRRIIQNRIPLQAFEMLDANNDGGLDEAEIPDAVEGQFSFERLDQDNDGKLTYQEINQSTSKKRPIWSVQVRGRAAEYPDAVFAYLDRNHDQFLSTREILQAGDRLREVADQKSYVLAGDIPDAFLIQLGRGKVGQDEKLFAIGGGQTDADDSRPTWARSMDANRDGDVSHTEFPGPIERFYDLDRNGDGFLDNSEVENLP